jgi:hypothetical protein
MTPTLRARFFVPLPFARLVWPESGRGSPSAGNAPRIGEVPPVATTDDKARRAAQNQYLFHYINETIAEIRVEDGVPITERWEFLCECCSPRCQVTISLTRDEYEAARRLPSHFPIALGHNAPDIERIISLNERYAVVEEYGEAGVTATELDPRTGTAT